MTDKIKSKIVKMHCKINIALALVDPSTPDGHFPQGKDNTLREKLFEIAAISNELMREMV